MFRISIRDLLWLTVVVALGVGWWLEHWRASEDMRRMAEANAKLRYDARVAKEEVVLLQGRLSRRSGGANESSRLPSEDPFK
jgi:hypothetical protein